MDPLLSDLETAERAERRWICIARIAAVLFGVAAWLSVLSMRWWPVVVVVSAVGCVLVILQWAGWSARLADIHQNEQRTPPE